jgi:hypothetical protein
MTMRRILKLNGNQTFLGADQHAMIYDGLAHFALDRAWSPGHPRAQPANAAAAGQNAG